MDALRVGDILDIDGLQYVLTTEKQETVKQVDRDVDGPRIDAFMRAHPQYRFVRVVREMKLRRKRVD